MQHPPRLQELEQLEQRAETSSAERSELSSWGSLDDTLELDARAFNERFDRRANANTAAAEAQVRSNDLPTSFVCYTDTFVARAVRGVQILAYEAEHGRRLPAMVNVAGSTSPVPIFRALNVTGTRFLNTFVSDWSVDATAGERPSKRARTFERGHDAFTSALRSDAPAQLTTGELLEMVDAANVACVDALIDALPVYVRPVIEEQPVFKVRSRHAVFFAT